MISKLSRRAFVVCSSFSVARLGALPETTGRCYAEACITTDGGSDAQRTGCALIFVLGHSGCGAVKSAIKHLDGNNKLPGSINGLVDLVKPAVTKVHGEQGDELDNAVRPNVQISIDRIRRLPPIIEPRVRDGRVKVAGGVYDLGTGKLTLTSS
jgi:carbonic anhydrase